MSEDQSRVRMSWDQSFQKSLSAFLTFLCHESADNSQIRFLIDRLDTILIFSAEHLTEWKDYSVYYRMDVIDSKYRRHVATLPGRCSMGIKTSDLDKKSSPILTDMTAKRTLRSDYGTKKS